MLGIPLLIVIYVLAAAFTLVTAAFVALFFAAGIAAIAGSVYVIISSFSLFAVNVPTALVCIGASAASIGIGLFLILLSIVIARHALPYIVRRPFVIENRLGLFR